MSTHNQELYARGTRAKQWYQRYGYHVLSGHAKTHMVGLLDENEALRVKVAQLEAEIEKRNDLLIDAQELLLNPGDPGPCKCVDCQCRRRIRALLGGKK